MICNDICNDDIIFSRTGNMLHHKCNMALHTINQWYPVIVCYSTLSYAIAIWWNVQGHISSAVRPRS